MSVARMLRLLALTLTASASLAAQGSQTADTPNAQTTPLVTGARVERPLSAGEQSRMPDADTVQLVDLPDFRALLRDVGFSVVWQRQCTGPHQRTATALLESFGRDYVQIAGEIGRRALADLIAAHQLWSDWLRSGRVRKYAMVAVSQ